jgi:hypothetical protein
MYDFVTSSSGSGWTGFTEVTVNDGVQHNGGCDWRYYRTSKTFRGRKGLRLKVQSVLKKDSQTNRFNRHEVKNGLLSNIDNADALMTLKIPLSDMKIPIVAANK